jgi:hypothetical protein
MNEPDKESQPKCEPVNIDGMVFPEGIDVGAGPVIPTWPAMKEMDKLVAAIEREIDEVEKELGEIPPDFAEGICLRFSDDWCIIRDIALNGEHYPPYPEWLEWIVVGVLKKKGITEL